ncbi:MAG: thiamine pyrophosphate-binding protein [Deltaproteobacteria bacterium]
MVSKTHAFHVTPEKVVRKIVDAGVTHIPYLPGTERDTIHNLLTAAPELSLVPVCREGETMAIATGLIIGGKKPMVMIQNTGMFESGDSIRGFTYYARLPLVMMIGYRGWVLDGQARDSAGIYTQPILDAWRATSIPLITDEDLDRIPEAYTIAEETGRPVALLLPDDASVPKTPGASS